MTPTDSWVYWRFQNGHEDLGAFGERLWQRIMLDCGFYYVPLKDLPPMQGKGPRLQGADVVLPDFDVMTNRRRIYMDSKCKKQSVMFEKAREIRHGIDRKYYRAYEAISALNRQRCALGICELFTHAEGEWSGSLLIQTLAVLGHPIDGFSNQSHMVYWPRRRFTELGNARPLSLWNLANGEITTPDSVKQRLVEVVGRPNEPPTQGRLFV